MNASRSYLKFEPTRVVEAAARAAVWTVIFLAMMLTRSASALTFNFTYDTDANFMAAGLTPADITAMKAANTFAAKQFTDRYSDNINVNITVKAVAGTSTFGMSTTPFDDVANYAALRTLMVNDAAGADDATSIGAAGSVPAGADPIATNHSYLITRSQAKALGLRANDMENDGTFTFGGGHVWTYDPNNRAVPGKNDFIGVAMHEYSEIMGRNSLMGNDLGTGTPFYVQYDLFHYTGPGARGLNRGPGRFFSIDNGTSLLRAFNDETANQGDNQDWAAGPPDSFNAFGSAGEQADLTPVDLRAMDIVGYNMVVTGGAGLVGNVSTRLPVGTGDNALIEGFIVQGPAGSTKKMVVRAIGPSLAAFGVTDAVANPTLGIFDASNAQIASNDNWKTTQVGGIITGDQFAEINGSGVAPGNDLESAIVANLTPASYTAVVRGANNTVGTGLVDAYDLSPASTARVANVATRGLVQPGDRLLIGGFIIQNGPVRVVVRAIGPSLAAFGITNALPDTTLQLRDQNGNVVRENDDWMTDQAVELQSIGLQPTNNLEAALVQTIQPGPYTAQVRGKPETTGTGVVEVYFLQ